MPSADQVPINSPHSTMLGGSWVVLIAGSTGRYVYSGDRIMLVEPGSRTVVQEVD